MPNTGDQHNDKVATRVSNPYEESKPHLSEYTAQEIATLSSRLEKQLGPEYISSRPGAGGGKVHYLAADKCINLANEVFGFNGWSSSIQQIQIDFVDENASTGKISLGLSVIVRVSLRDGTYHEDIGYGHIENCKGKAPAFEKAKKEGTTDGLKRALRNFGNLLGNCVYDKDYVARVTKLRVAPTRWDPENLHRHSDFAPAKMEQDALTVRREPSMRRIESHEDEFGSDDFDEVDFAVPEGEDLDGIAIPNGIESQHFRRSNSVQNREPRSPVGDPTVVASRPQRPMPKTPSSAASGHKDTANQVKPAQAPNHTRPIQQLSSNNPQLLLNPNGPPVSKAPDNPDHASADTTQTTKSSSASLTHEPPVGFFTARAAESLQNAQSANSLSAPSFNPHLESPSIPRTAGIDHSKSKPVNRDIIAASPSTKIMPSSAVARVGIGTSMGFTNPQTDKNRKVGMPGIGIGASPLQNRGSYKPPQIVKRPADTSRSALGDVTSATVNITGADGTADAKRQRIGVEDAGVATVTGVSIA